MNFDVNTLYASTVLVLGLVGLLLLWAWFQNPKGHALIWWACSFFFSTIGVVLLSDRHLIDDLWSIEIALTLLIVAHGLVWAGVRSFAGRGIPWLGILIGAIVWMVAYQTQEVRGSTTDRVVLMAVLSAVYTIVTAWELIRDKATALRSGRAALGLLALHTIMLLFRLPVAARFPLPFRDAAIDPHMAVLAVEPMLFAVALGFMLLMMTRERVEATERAAALTDPLTGILNRRGFFEAASYIRQEATKRRQPMAALLLDLDYFKSVNDTHGHAAGDEVLHAFAIRVREVLRSHDVFGRIGGEEFAVVFADADEDAVRTFAERLRSEVAVAPIDWRGTSIDVTASIGVAVGDAAKLKVETLLEAADRALYEAKRRGRNCVVVADAGKRPLDHPVGGPV